jgi:Skp family chaperone for outer membrane proteins
MSMIKKLLFGFVVFVTVTGCNPAMNRVANDANPETEAVVNTVVVDLDVVSKASGQDDVIENQMKAVNADLTLQLGEIVTSFNKQLAEQKKKFGADISVDEQQKLQEMLIKANQLLAQKQTEANLKAQQHKEGLIKTWRDKIQPLVKSIAVKKGATVVLVQGSSVMWFDSEIDITGEVIAALRENPVSSSGKADKVKIPIGSGDVI